MFSFDHIERAASIAYLTGEPRIPFGFLINPSERRAFRSEGKRIDFPEEGDKQGDKMENKNVRMPNVLRAKVSTG